MPRISKKKLELYINKLYRAEIKRLKLKTKKKGSRISPSSNQGSKVVDDCGRKCAVCSKKYDEDPRDFHIHHINGDRSMTITSNLILLCLSHHNKIHDDAKAKIRDYKVKHGVNTTRTSTKPKPKKPKMVTVTDALGRRVRVPIGKTKVITNFGRKIRVLKDSPWKL